MIVIILFILGAIVENLKSTDVVNIYEEIQTKTQTNCNMVGSTNNKKDDGNYILPINLNIVQKTLVVELQRDILILL